MGGVWLAGGAVIATPDHLFATPGGWVRADCLTNRMVCNTILGWQTQLSSPPLDKTSSEKNTTYAGSTFNEMVGGFIEKFGNTIGGPFLQNTTSTTEMRTGLTTSSRIWSAFLGRLTCFTTVVVSHIRKLWQRGRLKKKNGMGVRLGERGTGNSTSPHLRPSTFGMSQNPARFVERDLLHQMFTLFSMCVV